MKQIRINMKRVSFKTAKALKEAGYPIEIKSIEEAEKLGWQGKAFFTGTSTCGLCPYVMNVWLWLCENITYIGKRRILSISIHKGKHGWSVSFNCECINDDDGIDYEFCQNTQEEAIIAAIEYLVENGLLFQE